MTRFLLLHPPLLGPSTWRPAAEALAQLGHRVAVPDLRPATTRAPAWWSRAADLCGAADVVVAHSGAGVLVPLAVARAGAHAAVFVDAVVPAVQGETVPDAGLRHFVTGLESDGGRLPPWSTWWGPDVMAELVPDPAQRRLLTEDEPRLPVDFYDVAVPVPADWQPPVVGYLRLSEAYDDDAAEAERRNWTVRRLDGTHLDPLTRPSEVVREILSLSGV